MRNTLAAMLLAGLSATTATAIEPVVDPGEAIEARVDGDLNGDGEADLAYVVGTGSRFQKKELVRILGTSLSGTGSMLKVGYLSTDYSPVLWRFDGKGELILTSAKSVVVMSPRPGRIAAIKTVNTPRPRTVASRATPEAGNLSVEIFEMLTGKAAA
jgi:hypothetical protein